MGRVVVNARIDNKEGLDRVRRGELPEADVRSVEVSDALVDTGAVMLSLPKRYIAPLGLTPTRQRPARTAAGLTTLQVYDVVRLSVEGRDVPCEVVEIPDECPALIGQIPLEGLDFIVDPINQRLIGNPERGGQHMRDMF